MKTTRWIWLLGVMALVTSVVGAGLLHNSKPLAAGPQDTEATTRSQTVGLGVVCIGHYDIEGGMLKLVPLQPGPVTEVLCYEGQAVKKGTPLVKVEDDAFIKKVAEAEAGVQIAETQVAQARQVLDSFAEVVSQQEAAVRAASEKVNAAKENYKRVERYRNLSTPQASAEELKASGDLVKVAEAQVDAEKAKLREVLKRKPDPKVEEAQRNVEMRKAQVEQAREALSRCTLTAPQDGVVLRMQATVGSQYGPQSHVPAVEFAPDGRRIVRVEVEQEFAGRVTLNATAQIQDETNTGPVWHGKVIRIGDAFLPKRQGLSPELITTASDTRVLEAIVAVDPAATMPKLGQRLRVSIGAAAR